MNDLPEIAPGLCEFMAEFSSCAVIKDGVRLNYIPVRTSAPDLPLEGMRNLRLSGRYPSQLYEEFQRGFLLPSLVVFGARNISHGFCAPHQ